MTTTMMMVMSWGFDSLCSLEFCIDVFAFEVVVTSTNWLKVGDILHGSVYIWDFLQPCMDTSASCFLLPLMAELLSLYIVSLSSSLIRLTVGILSCFPEGGATTQVCGFPFPQNPACFLSTEASLDCFLSIRALSSHHTWNVYKDLATEWGRCGFHIWAIWVTHGPGQGDPWWAFPNHSWVSFLREF